LIFLQPDPSSFLEVPETKSPFHYDIAFLYAHAVKKMLADHADVTNGTLLNIYLRKISFEGVTGEVTITPGENNRGVVLRDCKRKRRCCDLFVAHSIDE
jgi:hypothetical protein